MGLLGAREGCSAACSLPAQRAGGHTRASGARASAAPSCASELPLSDVARDALLTGCAAARCLQATTALLPRSE
ncbi:hypothetical protein B5X24_HaOG215014 [Helicoverpa armigera]|uniref:Uncharacterized protein n=1 Tax=Helicoverpa armigera TaxID=29058 RepID=A0A2W1B3S8_HELAM|nr:hypothetical protein B5X24_HaOG215014 [Helicoverpa armigera]